MSGFQENHRAGKAQKVLGLSAALCALLASCVTPAPPPSLHIKPQTRELVHFEAYIHNQLEPDLIMAHMTLSHRSDPIAVPLWLTIAPAGEREDSACDYVRTSAVPAPRGRLYVAQLDQSLGEPCTTDYAKCMHWDLAEEAWSETECINMTGAYTELLTHVHDNIYYAEGFMEGGKDGVVFRWNSDDTFTSLFPYVLDSISWQEDHFEILSACQPTSGESAQSFADDAPEHCATEDDACGYCEMMYGESVRWSWVPGQELVRMSP